MSDRYCNYCGTSHPLTAEFWYRLSRSPKCKTRARDTHTSWKVSNPNKYSEYASRYYQNNRQKVIQANYRYANKRREVDISYNLTIILRQRLNKALRGKYKTGSAVSDLGCSIDNFKLYLEGKFKPGMSWENYGRE